MSKTKRNIISILICTSVILLVFFIVLLSGIQARAVTQLIVSTQPAGAVDGVNLTTQPVIQALDDEGNIDIDKDDIVITATVSTDNVSAGGTITAIMNDGEAIFTGLRTDVNGFFIYKDDVVFNFSGNFGYEEKVTPTVFGSGATDGFSSTILNNDNVLITYEDEDNLEYGTFVIYDQDGNLVKSATVFNSGGTRYISATTLINGNVLIAYKDADNLDYGTFVIYDQNGNIVKPATVFYEEYAGHILAITLNNGNVLIAYTGNPDYGSFVIYNDAGDLVKSQTIFNSGYSDYLSATILNNDNILITYKDYDKDYGPFVIYDQDGNLVKLETIYKSGEVFSSSTITLTNGNILIAYYDPTNFGRGTFIIYDQNGGLVKPATIFTSGEVSMCSLTITSDDNVLIVYKDGSNYGTFVVYDEDGDLVKSETNFNSVRTYNPSPITLLNGDILISYKDKDNLYAGTFVIYGQNSLEVDANAIQIKIPTKVIIGRLIKFPGKLMPKPLIGALISEDIIPLVSKKFSVKKCRYFVCGFERIK